MQADVFVRRRNNTLIFFGLLVLITAGSVLLTQFDFVKGANSFVKAFLWGASNFYPNQKSLAKLPDIMQKLRDTVLMSIAATSVAAIFSMLLALSGSKVTRLHRYMSLFARGIASFFRNIPLVAWAMVLMLAFSQSSLTGFLALFLGSFGFLTRAFMETLDEVGNNTVEALKATGAGYFHIIFQAVLPSSMPGIVSWLLFMIETNIRDATLVGFLTGTGIGFLFDVYYKGFDYHSASVVVIVAVLAVLIMESISNYIRRLIL